MSLNLIDFEQALDESKGFDGSRALLAGNGFSIDWRPTVFDYRSLHAEAELGGLSVERDALFGRIGTFDFENVIDHLNTAAELVALYGTSDDEIEETLRSDAKAVRDGLAEVIASRHPTSAKDLAEGEAAQARAFLTNFQEVFTVNYDLLLYWVTNWHSGANLELPRRDGFEWRTESGPKEELIWKERPTQGAPQIFYLHGALHLYEDGLGRLLKIQSDPSDPIIATVRDRIRHDTYPHVVTEGRRRQKMQRIKASNYLRHAHQAFGSLYGTLFIHGMSLSVNDSHIAEQIERRESQIHTIYVSVHGAPDAPENEPLIASAQQMAHQRAQNGGPSVAVKFYRSESAHIWR